MVLHGPKPSPLEVVGAQTSLGMLMRTGIQASCLFLVTFLKFDARVPKHGCYNDTITHLIPESYSKGSDLIS